MPDSDVNCRKRMSERVYQAWLDGGCPEGTPDKHWYEAEKHRLRRGRRHRGRNRPSNPTAFI